MKKQTKIWLLIASFALLFTLVFAIGAFATEETPEPDTTNPLYTPYGMIPEDYADVDLYPFVAFDDKGTCLGAEAVLITDGNAGEAPAIFHKVWKKTGTFYIYMRKDCTHANGAFNISSVNGNVIVDLGGHTLSYTKSITVQIKTKGYNSRVTFKNGNMHAAANVVFLTQQVLTTKDRRMNVYFTFENVNFSVYNGYKQGTWLSYINAEQVNADTEKGYRSDLTIRNCTFDTTNIATTTYIATVGHSTGQIASDVLLSGIHIEGSASKLALIKQSYTEDVNITYEKNEQGHILTQTRSTTSSIPEHLSFYHLPEGPVGLVNPISTEGDMTTYGLGTHERLTSYGWIPERSFGNTNHPFLIFSLTDHTFVASANQWGGEKNDETGAVGGVLQKLKDNESKGDLVIYVQADLKDNSTTKAFYNLGTLTGNYLVDLNGHTLQPRDIMFYMQAKVRDNNVSSSFTIKNGTLVASSVQLIRIGSLTGEESYSATTTFLFDNVTIQSNGGALVTDNTGGNYDTTTNITFRNCTFTYSNYAKQDLFTLGAENSTTHTVNIVMDGGTIKYPTTAFPMIYNQPEMANKSLTFVKGQNGYTEIITNKMENLTEGNTYAIETGSAIFLQDAADEKSSYYRLKAYGFISAYLNLTNDLNLVYRIAVPTAFTNPSVTFTVGTSTVTVTEYTVDENGYYCYKLPNINPARMGMTVCATFTAALGEQTVTVTHDTLSVKKYAEALVAQNALDTALVELIDKLLVYGAATQQYLGDNVDNFVANIGELVAIPEAENTLTMSGEASDKGAIAYFGMNIDGAFAFRLGVTANVDGLTLVATKGGKTTTYNLADYTAKDGIITIVYDGILANELDEDVTFTLMLGDEVVGKTLTVNANAYLYRASTGENANLATLAKALYAYGASAKAYVG